MGAKLSISEVVAGLEARLAYHRQQEAFHVEQEAHHRDQRAAHAADMETVQRKLETFKSAAESVEELARNPDSRSSEPESPKVPNPGRGRLTVNKMVRAVVDLKPDGQPFGSYEITQEVNRHFADRLSEPVDVRTISGALRHLKAAHGIHLVRPGRAHHEALYVKGPRPAKG